MKRKTDQQKLKEFLTLFDEDILVVDGQEDAFMGVANMPKVGYVAVYSSTAIIENLMKNDLMDFATAEEFFHYNIMNNYVGAKTPIFLDIVPDCFWK